MKVKLAGRSNFFFIQLLYLCCNRCMKKTCRPCFSESKGGHGRVWNKTLYVTWDESRFSSWVVTALTKRFFSRVITHTLVQNLVARAVPPPAGKICYFHPLLHNVLLRPRCEMSSSTSEVGFRNYLSHKSVKSYTRRTNIIFRRRERNLSP